MRHIFLFVAVLAAAPLVATTGQADGRYPCRDVHTFDFWVGTFESRPWNQPDAPPTGTLRNTREYERLCHRRTLDGRERVRHEHVVL